MTARERALSKGKDGQMQLTRMVLVMVVAYLVQRSKTSPVPPYASHFSQCLLERSTKCYRAIL